MVKQHIQYQVSLKLLLQRGGEVLLLRTDRNYVDLPGGRIDAGEEKTLIEKIIRREIREELGKNVRFHVKGPLFSFRGRSKYGILIFMVVYEGEYLAGSIKLSNEHKSYAWIEKRRLKLKRNDFSSRDNEEYLAFKKYFFSTKT